MGQAQVKERFPFERVEFFKICLLCLIFLQQKHISVTLLKHIRKKIYCLTQIIIIIIHRDETGVQDTFLTHEVYKDEITLHLVAEACKLLGVFTFITCFNI